MQPARAPVDSSSRRTRARLSRVTGGPQAEVEAVAAKKKDTRQAGSAAVGVAWTWQPQGHGAAAVVGLQPCAAQRLSRRRVGAAAPAPRRTAPSVGCSPASRCDGRGGWPVRVWLAPGSVSGGAGAHELIESCGHSHPGVSSADRNHSICSSWSVSALSGVRNRSRGGLVDREAGARPAEQRGSGGLQDSSAPAHRVPAAERRRRSGAEDARPGRRCAPHTRLGAASGPDRAARETRPGPDHVDVQVRPAGPPR